MKIVIEDDVPEALARELVKLATSCGFGTTAEPDGRPHGPRPCCEASPMAPGRSTDTATRGSTALLSAVGQPSAASTLRISCGR